MRLRNIPRAEGVLKECSQVIETPEEFRDHWASDVFQNDYPVHIEIGMGKGRFLMALAQKNPQINYIGIERYSSVLLRAVEKFQELEAEGKAPANIRFICMDANDLPTVFAPAEVSRIYLNFSDPWPKARHARRRLTSNEFFKLYDKVLTADGTVEFKTDNHPLFDFSVEELKTSELFVLDQLSYNLHNDSKMNQGNIMTASSI